MLLLVGGDLLILAGGVRGLGGGVRGRPMGDRALCGVLERDFLERLIGLCLKFKNLFVIAMEFVK